MAEHFLSSMSLGAGRPSALAAVVLAPMTGISDVVFRRLAYRFGAGLVVTEMVAADAYVRGVEEARLRAEGEGVSPHTVQLVGRDPARMAEAARLAEAAGADLLDINMGCPAKRVTGGLAGSALMREPDLALRIVAAVVRAVAVPVTVKMRLGWDDLSLNAAELARRAEAEGVALVTVHGRTRAQFYKGRADWAAVAAVKRAVRIPLVVNGDCTSAADARAMLAASGADAVMIGRAAVGRPWLVGGIAEALRSGVLPPAPGLAARREAALDHFDALLSLFGAAQGNRHARKHLVAYADHLGAEVGDAGGRSAILALRAGMATSDDHRATRRMLGQLFDVSAGMGWAA